MCDIIVLSQYRNKMMQGVYIIKNTITEEVYVGSTTNLKKRINDHKSSLKRNDHENKFLQQSYNQYKKKVFEFIILEEYENPDREFLYKREDFYMIKFKDNLFNINPNAKSNKGIKITEEAKQKISKHSKKMWQDPEFKKKMSNRKPSEETKKKMSETHKGRKYTLGYKHSEEFSKKISERMKINNPFKGKKHSEETRKKMSEAQKNRPPISEATRQKLRDAASKQWERQWLEFKKIEGDQ